MRYIIIYNPSLRLIGPFENRDDMSEWGRKWQEANGDNPCWSELSFDVPTDYATIRVERPDEAHFF